MNRLFIRFSLFVLCLWIFPHFPSLAQSLLWKIEGNGLKFPSYLYGTMHVRDSRVFKVNHVVVDKFESCSAFAAELALDSINPSEVLFLLKSDKNASLKDLLTKKDYKLAERVLRKKLGIELKKVEHLQPVYLLSLLQQNDLMNPKTGGTAKFLDQQLYDNAKARGMYTTGLEDVKEQLKALGSLSPDAQALMLVEVIKNFDKIEAKSGKEQTALIETYLKGDLQGLLQLFKDEEMPELMRNQLLDVRNHNMTERILPLIQKQATFVAVGAAHLPGEKGVIQLLRNKGYSVEAIPFQFDGTGFERLTQPAASGSSFVSITPSQSVNPPEEEKAPVAESSNSGNEGGWTLYKSNGGKYSIKFPEKPTETTNEVDGKTSYTAMVIKNGGMKSYSSSYINGGGDIEKNISEKIKEVLAQFKGEITGQKDIVVHGLKGKEITIEVMSMVEITLKIFGDSKTTYSLSYSRMLSDSDLKDRDLFFNSFQLIK
jgi:uncharacterized protein YbaP (TraB family)